MEVNLPKKTLIKQYLHFDLLNKNFIITGGLGFLGKHFSEVIAKFNGNPIILDKSKKNAKDFVLYLKNKYSCNAIYFNADISNEVQIKKILKVIEGKKIKINGIVNNAAINPTFSSINETKSLLENYSLKTFDKEVDVGLKGSLICTKIFGNHMAKNKEGTIVNISSDLGIIAPNQDIYNSKSKRTRAKPVSYSIIKFGLIGLTKYTASYWSKNNVRCNALAPAGIYDNQDKNFVSKLSKLIPMNRMMQLDELSGSLIFLLSNSSSYVNGHTLIIDGGRSIW